VKPALEIIRAAAAEGVTLVKSSAGTVEVTGHSAAVARWLDVLRDNKPAILAELAAASDGPAASMPASVEADNAPHYRWLIIEADGRRREVCTLPEMTRNEVAACYPGAQLLPLPDSARDASKLIHEPLAA
jgi:hypothetical protein